ncbi:type VII secretion protein EccE [Stackebrandtia albiflava]|uniref:Type VII secretion protein EccE n=1 Tax=Stackebrandtia albiflava TaxID=406432 RepID=A0A562VBZ4_9ACTN|nr:type VII secretion protein EccE [Stackebrandtia albiflava]TWJ15399.1 type VII secretion protein EccE [Stackebrandtia albiflava]
MAVVGLPVHRDRPGVGDVGLGRLVAVEFAAAGALLSWHLPDPYPYVLTGVGVLVAAVILLSGFRGIGRRVALRLRTARFRRGAQEIDVAGNVLAGLAPGLDMRDVTERGTRYGVAFDGAGWFTVVALDHSDATAPVGLESGMLRALSSALLGADRGPATIQVVTHMVPAPSAEVDADAACARSYAELLGDDPVVSHHMTWLAVRLDGRDAASVAAARGGGSEGARRAVVASTRRLTRYLTDNGVDHRVLPSDSLRLALAHSVSGETVSAALHRRAFEERRAWRVGALAHVVFGVEGRITDVDRLRRLWMSMAMLSTSFSAVSVVFRPLRNHGPAASGVRLQTMLRVAYDAGLNESPADELVRAAAECGVHVWRHDGEHAAATYASAPTGGGSRARNRLSRTDNGWRAHMAPMAESHVTPDDLAGHGNHITSTGDEIAATVTSARELGIEIPGLATSAAFAWFRDRMADRVAGPQRRISDAGVSVVNSDHSHLANDGDNGRPFDRAFE